MSKQSTIPAGRVIAGKYRVESFLAEGGMGAVYEATHLRLDRTVALKLLHHRHTNRRDSVERFSREARKAASLVHPGIVDVRDYGEDETYGPYLEMELLRGCSLADVIGHGLVPIGVGALIMYELVEALVVAHAQNIVHRDLKPANVFLALGAGGGARVKILDFGIAKAVREGLTESTRRSLSETLTQTGVIMGTLHYMSPEQLTDFRDVDHRADIYAVGATCFEMFTGRRVVDNGAPIDAINRVIQGQTLRHISETRPDAPVSLDAIIAQALAPNKVHRFADAQELLVALSPFVTAAARPRLADVVNAAMKGERSTHLSTTDESTRVHMREPVARPTESAPPVTRTTFWPRSKRQFAGLAFAALLVAFVSAVLVTMLLS